MKKSLNQKRGERLRQEYNYYKRETGGNQDKFSEMLHITRQTLNRYFKGSSGLDDLRCDQLAALLHVRVEYLKCQDDFRTDEEMLSELNQQELQSYRLHKELLSSLGIEITPKIRIIIDHDFIKENPELLQEYTVPDSWPRSAITVIKPIPPEIVAKLPADTEIAAFFAVTSREPLLHTLPSLAAFTQKTGLHNDHNADLNMNGLKSLFRQIDILVGDFVRMQLDIYERAAGYDVSSIHGKRAGATMQNGLYFPKNK